NAADGNAVCQRKARDFFDEGAGGIPDFDRLGKASVWPEERIRPLEALDEEMLSVRGWLDRGENAWLPQGGELAGGNVKEGQLRLHVIVEEIGVVRSAQ